MVFNDLNQGGCQQGDKGATIERGEVFLEYTQVNKVAMSELNPNIEKHAKRLSGYITV